MGNCSYFWLYIYKYMIMPLYIVFFLLFLMFAFYACAHFSDQNSYWRYGLVYHDHPGARCMPGFPRNAVRPREVLPAHPTVWQDCEEQHTL